MNEISSWSLSNKSNIHIFCDNTFAIYVWQRILLYILMSKILKLNIISLEAKYKREYQTLEAETIDWNSRSWDILVGGGRTLKTTLVVGERTAWGAWCERGWREHARLRWPVVSEWSRAFEIGIVVCVCVCVREWEREREREKEREREREREMVFCCTRKKKKI